MHKEETTPVRERDGTKRRRKTKKWLERSGDESG
jgi:hypothetical protein